MGLFRAPERPFRKPQRRSRLSLAIFLLMVYGVIKLLGNPAPANFHLTIPAFFTRRSIHQTQVLPALVPPGSDYTYTPPPIYHFSGWRVRHAGTDLDLGDKRTRLPASLVSRFFPSELIVPSCLTQPVPPAGPPVGKPLPVRDDWPGFYGAPWIAHLNGNLVALLHVTAPRQGTVIATPPEFQIYAAYNGQISPDFDAPAPASFQRGSKAALYRVFPNGPISCLDLVVQNGENNGVAHLYYQKYHHYYEMDTIFRIQP